MNVDRVVQFAGKAAGIVGVLFCLVTGIQRAAGGYFLLGFESATLFEGGVALMVFYCVAKLHVLGLKE